MPAHAQLHARCRPTLSWRRCAIVRAPRELRAAQLHLRRQDWSLRRRLQLLRRAHRALEMREKWVPKSRAGERALACYAVCVRTRRAYCLHYLLLHLSQRLVAGALGVRHPALPRSSGSSSPASRSAKSSPAATSESGVGLEETLAALKMQG